MQDFAKFVAWVLIAIGAIAGFVQVIQHMENIDRPFDTAAILGSLLLVAAGLGLWHLAEIGRLLLLRQEPPSAAKPNSADIVLPPPQDDQPQPELTMTRGEQRRLELHEAYERRKADLQAERARRKAARTRSRG